MKTNTENSDFLKWYDEFSDAIFRHVAFRLSDREKAVDVTQEVFIRLWDTVTKGNKIENPRALLYKIANNLIVDEYRKKKTVSLDEMRDEQDFDIGYGGRGDLENGDDHVKLLHLISQLPEPYKDVLTMRHVDGFSVKEIARRVGETENVVSVRIHRAIQKIKDEYEKHY